MNRSLRRSSAAVAAALSLLSGCGSTPPPGVAATVGDAQITDEQVDELALVLCRIGLGPTTREARSSALDLLINDVFIDNLTDGVDVDRSTVTALSQQLAADGAGLPEELVPRFDELVTDVATSRAALTGLGRESLEAAGQRNVTDEIALQEGARLLQAAMGDTEVRVDPRFGDFEGGVLVPGSGSLSVPVSDLAVAAVTVPDPEAEPDPAAETYADLVPQARRCDPSAAAPAQ